MNASRTTERNSIKFHTVYTLKLEQIKLVFIIGQMKSLHYKKLKTAVYFPREMSRSITNKLEHDIKPIVPN